MPEVVRGPNASRVYSDVIRRELDAQLATMPPVALVTAPEDGRLHLRSDEMDEHTLLARRMVLNTAALDAVVEGVTARILAPSTGDEVLMLNIHSIRTRSTQSHTLIGKIDGEDEMSSVHLVYHDGIINGTVVRYDIGQHFEYRMLPDNHLMVRELDLSSMTDGCGNCQDGCAHAEPANEVEINELINEANGVDLEVETQPDSEVAAATAGYTTVDVVVGYGEQARIAQGGYSAMEAQILLAVDSMSTAFADSGITNTEVMLLGTIEDPDYVFNGTNSGSMGDELDDLSDASDSNPSLNTVSDFSQLLGADLTSFVIAGSQGGTAGLASRPGTNSINSRGALGSNMTFSHELGHNLGCDHSWGDTSQTFKSNYGWRFENAGGTKFRTIMAYDGSYGRIPRFSNPSLNWDGVPTGAGFSHDVTGTLADQRYFEGGRGYNNGNPPHDPNLRGFDGSRADLAANNADGILNGTSITGDNRYGATYAANRKSRAPNSVIFPGPSTVWNAGNTETILYIGGDASDTATIQLYRAGVLVSTLAQDVNAAHSRLFSWNIPGSLFTASDYTIRVTLDYSGGGSDVIESNFFTIFGMDAGGVELLSPNGHEKWVRSSTQEITWDSSLGGNVKIELLKNNSEIATLASSTPNDGSFNWVASKDLAADTDYKIKITSWVDQSKVDQSTADFTILAPSSVLLLANMDTDPGFTVSGNFEYGTPESPNKPLTGFTGTKVYDTDLDASNFAASDLTTPAIDCTNHEDVMLEFYYHAATTSTVVFEVSNNNSSWTQLDSIPGGFNNFWVHGKYDISSVADGQPTVYVRWRSLGNGSQYGGGGLAIDDVSITGNFIPQDDIYLTSPSGGETLTRQVPISIEWTSGIGGDVKIELLKAGSVVRTLSESTPNDGSFATVLPASVVADNDYRIRISSLLLPASSTDSANDFTIVAPSSTVYTENFNTNPGYATTGDFEYGAPSGNNLADAAYTGTNMYDTKLDNTSFAASTLTSTAIDCSSHTNLNLSFWYHPACARTIYFEVSNDNSSWTVLDTLPGQFRNSWREGTYDISAVADGQSTVYIRWRVDSGSEYGGGGLAIDDVTITGTFSPGSFGYDITYNGGGGTTGTPPAPGTKQQGVNATLSDKPGSLAKSGFYLTGWNTQLNGGGTPYALGATYSTDANLTLYAQWAVPPYDLWSAGPAPEVDSNGDGVSNGLAWVLGAANPSADARAMQPTLDNDSDPDFFIFTHRRSDDAYTDPNTTITVEYGSDLAGWTEAVHDGTDVIINVTNDVDPGVDEVEVRLRRSLSNFGRFFSRLRADFSN